MDLTTFIWRGGRAHRGTFPRALARFRQALPPGTRLSLIGLCGVLLFSVTMCSFGQLPPATPLRVIAGSGFSSFEPILKRFGEQNRVDVQITYKGSIDIMLLLQQPGFDYDAIWDGDSLWTTLGDEQHKPPIVKYRESIMRSPIIFGIKRSIAEKLGWTGKDVHMQDILNAAESSKLRIVMTSATQSNSGTSAYFGFLYAFANNPDVLSAGDLKDPAVGQMVKRILGTIDRTSESSGWLRDLFAAQYDRYDAMFNYESHVIELNQKLAAGGREPLFIIYPVEGLGIADFPLSFVSRPVADEADREAAFHKLQQYLLSDAVQDQFAAKGRRIGRFGATADHVDRSVFNPEWGVDVTRVVNAIKYPSATVIREALNLYQTTFRKASYTVYCLDFSGSMEGKGEQQLKQAMRTLLDPQEAGRYFLQGSDDDITLVLTFNSVVINGKLDAAWTVSGNDPTRLNHLLTMIQDMRPGGGTNIYAPVAQGLQLMQTRGIGNRIPAIILMTDGQSNSGALGDVREAIARTGLSVVPVYGITFGDAQVDQLKALADLTSGRVFDGTTDLLTAFRSAKGNN